LAYWIKPVKKRRLNSVAESISTKIFIIGIRFQVFKKSVNATDHSKGTNYKTIKKS